MFDETFKAVIRRVSLKAREDDNAVLRRILDLQLRVEFTDSLARGLGKAAVEARVMVKDGDLSRAVLPVDAVQVNGTFYATGGEVGPDQHTVKGMKGLAATLTSGKEAENEAQLTIGMEFSWSEESLIYFAKHLGEEVSVKLRATQLSIPGTEGRLTGGKKKGAGVGKKRSKKNAEPEAAEAEA